LGLLQWVVAGLFLSLAPGVPGVFERPGAFAFHPGPLEFLVYLAINLSYGGIVGEYCERLFARRHMLVSPEVESATTPLADSLGQGFKHFEEYKKKRAS
jgi:hypothetical protein